MIPWDKPRPICMLSAPPVMELEKTGVVEKDRTLEPGNVGLTRNEERQVFLDSLGIPLKSLSLLKENGIETVGALDDQSDSQLRAILKSEERFLEVTIALKRHGLKGH